MSSCRNVLMHHLFLNPVINKRVEYYDLGVPKPLKKFHTEKRENLKQKIVNF